MTSPQWATNAEVWVYFLLRPVDIQLATFKSLVQFETFAHSVSWAMTLNADGTVRLASSSVATSVGAMGEGTNYHCWLHFNEGVNLDFSFSTDGIRPTSGDNYVNLNSGIQAGKAYSLRIGASGGALTCEYIFDRFRVDDAQIGDNPP